MLVVWVRPLVLSITHYLLLDRNEAGTNHELMLGSIGAVLAGSIFGHHCSPISTTTVLSSASSGCEHLQHVFTQLPYAVAVAGVSLVLGYVPVSVADGRLRKLRVSVQAPGRSGLSVRARSAYLAWPTPVGH